MTLGEAPDDDAAEGRQGDDGADEGPRHVGRMTSEKKKKKKKKQKGINTDRKFGSSRDAIRLCSSVATSPEFSPAACHFGDRCNYSHDLRKYLKEGRRGDLDTFGGKCPVFEACGRCGVGWKCRFVSSHMQEVERDDGRKELVLIEDATRADAAGGGGSGDDNGNTGFAPGIVNIVSPDVKQSLNRKKVDFPKSNQMLKWLEGEVELVRKHQAKSVQEREETLDEYRAQFVDPPLRPSEKRKLYFGRETPVLAPLTTQGNVPFRRLCVELGAQGTYSEMALGTDLIGGKPSEWALLRAHRSEMQPPRYGGGSDGGAAARRDGYDHARDLKFGAQLAASAPLGALKATEALARYAPRLRLVDLNCGCPIDLIFKTGAGSALLDSTNKMERMVRGMNTVSDEIPITAKLRIGVRENHETAKKNIDRLAFGNPDTRHLLGGPGCAAVTLHGRTRQQRYRRPADWGFIAECAALVRSYQARADDLADTVREPDPSTQANTPGGRLYFLGNGDCFSYEHYFRHVDEARVDTVMIGRGALIKPWLFEEIEKGQYLDKSATERLGYIEKFARYGLEAWGADEVGIGTTRRFLLEYLSFACRYVPVGMLDYLPPNINDRAPAFRCRNDLEALLSSGDVKDWIKIR